MLSFRKASLSKLYASYAETGGELCESLPEPTFLVPTDEQIRELCARVLGAGEGDFEHAIRELQSAIRYRLEDLSNRAVATLLMMPRQAAQEAKAKTAAAGNDANDNDNDQREIDPVA